MTTKTTKTTTAKGNAVDTTDRTPRVSVEDSIAKASDLYGTVTTVTGNALALADHIRLTTEGLTVWAGIACEAKDQRWSTRRFAEATGSSAMMMGRLVGAARLAQASKRSKVAQTVSVLDAYSIANGSTVADVNRAISELEAGKVPDLLTAKATTRSAPKAVESAPKGDDATVSTDDKAVKVSSNVLPEHYATVLERIAATVDLATSAQSKRRMLASALAIVEALQSQGVKPLDVAAPKATPKAMPRKVSRTSPEAHDAALQSAADADLAFNVG